MNIQIPAPRPVAQTLLPPAADARGSGSRRAHPDPVGRGRSDREGLIDTPARVVRAYEEFFSGYGEDPVELLARSFEETDGYDEMVVLRDIRLESHCEHHMVPIIGRAHIAYLPAGRVVGISKLARARRLRQAPADPGEANTAQVANATSTMC